VATKALPLLFALLFVAAPALAHDEPHSPATPEYADDLLAFVPGANRLEGRIRAPCCWNQTLDIHGSEVSNELRREIRSRLRKGESAEAIEASLVERYGEKILAVPPGSPLKSVAILLSIAMAGAGVGGFFMLRRWRERGQKSKAQSPTDKAAAGTDKDYGARLDAELKALDD
jgi:cytochrome c-type biogenesis protein CcmH